VADLGLEAPPPGPAPRTPVFPFRLSCASWCTSLNILRGGDNYVLKEYKPGTAFNGVLGRTFDTSEQAWPEPKRAREALRTCCSLSWMMSALAAWLLRQPDQDPNMDALAENGLRYNNMHTTALCSPTRSCILTGATSLECHGVHYRGLNRFSRL